MKHRFTAGELSRLSGISKQTILFYDKKGILKPQFTDEKNGYRYYSADQLELLDSILMLKEMGLSLEEIRNFLEKRTGNDALFLMRKQLSDIHNKIQHLQLVEKRLSRKVLSLEDYYANREEVVFLQHAKAEILAVEKVHYPGSPSTTASQADKVSPDYQQDLLAQDIAVKKLLTKAKKDHYPYFYQQGAMVLLDLLKQRQYLRASFVFLPLEKNCSKADCLIKPPGLYAHYYFTGPYTKIGSGYQYLLSEIEKQGYQTSGYSYEYCILDSLTNSESEEYVTLIQLPVFK